MKWLFAVQTLARTDLSLVVASRMADGKKNLVEMR